MARHDCDSHDLNCRLRPFYSRLRSPAVVLSLVSACAEPDTWRGKTMNEAAVFILLPLAFDLRWSDPLSIVHW